MYSVELISKSSLVKLETLVLDNFMKFLEKVFCSSIIWKFSFKKILKYEGGSLFIYLKT